MTDVIARDDDHTDLVVRPLMSRDLPALTAMGRRCSPATVFHRFHGLVDLPSYLPTLIRPGQTTVVAWCGARCVGFASLAASAQGHEVGVLVEDDWQRRGVGTALFGALVAIARNRQVSTIRADVLFEDAFSLRLLSRYGSPTVTLEYGVYSILVELDEERV